MEQAGNGLTTKIGAAVHTRGSPLRDMVTKLEDGPPNRARRAGSHLTSGGNHGSFHQLVRRTSHTKTKRGTNRHQLGLRLGAQPLQRLRRHQVSMCHRILGVGRHTSHLIDLGGRSPGVGLPNSRRHGDGTPHGALQIGATTVQAQVTMQRPKAARFPTPGNGGTTSSGVTAAHQIPRLQSMDGKTPSGAASAPTLRSARSSQHAVRQAP